MPSPLVMFDLDGTLFHTAPDLMESLNHVIGGMGLSPVEYDDMTFLVGSGARAMIARALELRETEIASSEFEGLFTRFLEHYSASMPGTSQPYPGVVEAMDRLAAAGYALAVCTNKTETMARRLLKLTGHLPRFAAVTGGDTFAVRKPDADHLHGTVRLADGDPARSIMIGDSINDISAARRAGIVSIGVPFGYSETAMTELGPDHIISHYKELTPELVGRLLNGS